MLKSLQNQRWFSGLAVAFFSVLFVRNAWVAEDAYISFRTIDNFVHGYGLRWNIAERVQSFTHPLWLMLLTPFYAVYENIYFWAILLSYALSAVTVLLLVRKAVQGDVWQALVVCLSIFASKAFMDYTSSGLENPLSFFLTFALFSTFFCKSKLSDERRFFWLCFWSALCAVNRQDLILLAVPMLAYEGHKLWRSRSWWTVLKLMLLGFFPLLAWLSFSLVYYGFLFPNTYYAKLHTGLPKDEVLAQGLIYYLDSLGRDPVTLSMIGLILFIALGQKRARIAALGVLLYLLYIVTIGGDFMSGRFFSVPVVAALSIFVHVPIKPWLQSTMSFVALMLALCAAASPFSPVGSGFDFELKEIPSSGIADERGWYFQQMGLLKVNLRRFPQHGWRDLGEKWRAENTAFVEFPNVGLTGYYAGPGTHIVDAYALTDPFLSRLPATRSADGAWRIGHFYRQVPPDYIESLRHGTNTFTDSYRRELFDDMQLITREPLFSRGRFAAMVRRNFDR